MINLVNKNVKAIEMSGIRKIANVINEYPNAVNLTFGQPNFPTPDYIKEAGIKAIQDNQTAYTETAGIYELRKAACDYVHKLHGLSYNPDDEVIVTIGASEGLDIAFRTILEEGSEVILPAPVYPGYEPLIRMCNAIPVFVDTAKNNFKLTVSLLEEAITDKTRCIVLSYPSNPIGTIMTKKELQVIGKFLADKKIFIVADEIYSELIYEGKHYSVGAIPELKDRTIVLNGLSKSHAMTGWRIGFVFAPSYLTEEMYKVHSYNAICASTISQYAALEALIQGTHREEIVTMKKEYKERKEFVYNRLKELDLDVVEPQGAFYIFPSIKKTGLTSEVFAEKLLNQERVAVIPGNAFSDVGEGFIRISYAQSMKELKDGMDGIERLLVSLKT
ncbi:aminotransferase A [Sporosarcina ureilytica]|nr:aminotransferase A [Sporosarcina ureilytica]